ncbi:MAG: hypothetical protein HY064_16375 [Bacteroidetes bacterium]|nr:hypothetical protein [Bacteroidota bacterium]
MHRKIFFLFFIFIFSVIYVQAQRDPGDTLIVKRPVWVGIYVGFLQYTQATPMLINRAPRPDLLPQTIRYGIGDAVHGGVFLTYPFLHKMQWEIGGGLSSFHRFNEIATVTSVSSGNQPVVLAYHTSVYHQYLTVGEFRSYFSGEVVMHDNFTLLLGAGGWVAGGKLNQTLSGMEANPGTIGIELSVSAYYFLFRSSYVQVHINPGWMRNGYYINATVGLSVKGERTMRPHPKHYYVRTYEQDE